MQEQAFLLVKKNQQPQNLFQSLLHMYREWDNKLTFLPEANWISHTLEAPLIHQIY